MKRTFLVAGGGSGIGLESVKRLRADGARVIRSTRSPDRLSDDPDATLISFSAEDPSPTFDLPDAIDGVVYFPGTITLKPFRSLKSEDFLRDFEVNFLGATRFLQAALPSLKRSDSASVVLFSSVAVQTGLPFHASIAAAKGAVEGLTRSLAAEWAPKIRVNAIAPSLTNTPLASRLLGTEAKMEAAGERHPLKQIGSPADIAELVNFLLSGASKFITGQVFQVDGGLSSVRTF